jgi:hypothetical protein
VQAAERITSPWSGDSEAVTEEIREFLTGVGVATEPDRVLATVMFTDVVGSTERAAYPRRPSVELAHHLGGVLAHVSASCAHGGRWVRPWTWRLRREQSHLEDPTAGVTATVAPMSRRVTGAGTSGGRRCRHGQRRVGRAVAGIAAFAVAVAACSSGGGGASGDVEPRGDVVGRGDTYEAVIRLRSWPNMDRSRTRPHEQSANRWSNGGR